MYWIQQEIWVGKLWVISFGYAPLWDVATADCLPAFQAVPHHQGSPGFYRQLPSARRPRLREEEAEFSSTLPSWATWKGSLFLLHFWKNDDTRECCRFITKGSMSKQVCHSQKVMAWGPQGNAHNISIGKDSKNKEGDTSGVGMRYI